MLHHIYSFRQQQINNDSKLTELHNELKMKAFETERTQIVYEETCRTLKQEQLDNEKKHTKLEVSLIASLSFSLLR
jgi:progesterone-induced-blocking factor 1